MKTSFLFAVPTVAFGALAFAAGPAVAEDGSYQAVLSPANNSGTSGQAMIEVHGQKATVTMHVSGAAETMDNAPFPHAQHIHINGKGVCPGPEADTDGDGVVSSPEGEPFAGKIAVSLTQKGDTGPDSATAADRFPAGGAYTYTRTVTLDAATLQAIQAGKATVEVHGVDPNKLPAAAQKKTSPEDPSKPLAATLSAACGVLEAGQVSGPMPGAPNTGIEGQPAAGDDTAAVTAIAGLGAAVLAAAAVARRRRSARGE
jgi:MYXO-CTERM domain-containing protein